MGSSFWAMELVVLGSIFGLQALTDRRRQWTSGKPVTPPWQRGTFRQLAVAVPMEQCRAVAAEALVRCEAVPAPPRADVPWIVGYTRYWSWRGWRELAIHCEAGPTGTTSVWCCARPRSRMAVNTLSEGAATRLAETFFELGTLLQPAVGS